MTPRQAAAELRRRARALRTQVRDAERMSLLDLQSEAEELSSGPLQPADLVRMRHPYSRRRLRLNPDLVNSWTGTFKRGWQIDGPKTAGGDLVGRLENVDPKAKDMEEGLVDGKPIMAERHPEQEAWRRVAPRREQRLAEALERVFK